MTFALAEDASKAKECGAAASGRKLKIEFANKRPRQQGRKSKRGNEFISNKFRKSVSFPRFQVNSFIKLTSKIIL